MSLLADWSSMAQGLSSSGDWGAGPLGTSGAAAGIGGIVGGVGAGLAFMGMEDTNKAYGALASDSLAQAGLEKQVNALKQQQMHLTTNRQQMENLRNTQRAQAISKAAGVASGASLSGSSGYAGAVAGEAAAGGRNVVNLNQNQQIGDQTFGVENQISDLKAKMAQDQANIAKGAGMSQLGSGLLSGAMNIGMLLA